MTDRAQAFVVVLDDDYRLGDSVHGDNNLIYPIGADSIAMALRQIKGVISVEPIVANLEDHIARQRVRYELQKSLSDNLAKFFKGD